jgi:hypothetical protein
VKGKGTMDGMWKGKGKTTEEVKGKGKENRKAKCIVKPTPERNDITPAVALQLQKEMYEVDSDREGYSALVYSELE